MEEASNSNNNETINGEFVAEEEILGEVHVPVLVEKKELEEEEEEEEEDLESLKKRISEHPLYGLLIQAHFNCLKVVSGDHVGEIGNANQVDLAKLIMKSNISTSSSDLDHFMEGYCMALSNLKEAMEEPIEEASSFIKGMHIQLTELKMSSNSSRRSVNPKTP